jgi:hypothetical protein
MWVSLKNSHFFSPWPVWPVWPFSMASFFSDPFYLPVAYFNPMLHIFGIDTSRLCFCFIFLGRCLKFGRCLYIMAAGLPQSWQLCLMAASS